MLLFEVSLLRNVFEKHWIFSISAHPHIWRSRIKLLTLQGIIVSWYFSRQAYTRLLLVSQTVLRHFSDGHFAVTSQTSLHLGKKLFFYVKGKCGLNEDLCGYHMETFSILTGYDKCVYTEQFTYNVNYSVVVAHELISASSNCFRKKNQTVF